MCTKIAFGAKQYDTQMQLFVYRYTYTIAANVLVFSCFWILLAKINHGGDATSLTPGDKEIFWVSVYIAVGHLLLT